MKLSIEQQIKLLEGLDVWHTHPMGGLPSIMMADGPHGLRKQHEATDNLGIQGSVPATCFPTASLMACSFNRKSLFRLGELLAKEAHTQGVNIVLGPGINIKRSPLCGRNFEYYSEDPLLTGELAASFVKSMEEHGVGTSVKHFFANNQEKNRFFINSVVDQRALREIYIRAFERVIQEKPATLMTSYNKINGFHGTEHPYLKKIVRSEWKYKGVIVSDWGAVHDKVASLKASNDLEMPSSYGYSTEILKQAYRKDSELQGAIFESAKRISDLVEKYKTFPNINFNKELHHKEAKQLAIDSMVLVKNEAILPLNSDQNVLFIGDFFYHMRFQGGGSSFVNPTKVDHMSDIYGEYSSNIKHTRGYLAKDSHVHKALEEKAIGLAKDADCVVFIMGLPDRYETEGFDREHLDIPQNQIHLLEKIHAVNSNIVGVAIGGSVMNLSCEKYLKGLLITYLPGQAGSGAILDLLYGKANPSGRLAETWIDNIKECNVQLTQNNHSVYYDESIFVGYRYYHTFNKKVRYPFGYGLSYTTFEYDNFDVSRKDKTIIVALTIKNVGSYAGSEVIQVYVDPPIDTVHKAKRHLICFDKVELLTQESKTIFLTIPINQISFYDVTHERFSIEKGTYHISIGKNINEMIMSKSIDIEGEVHQHPKTSYLNETYDTSSFKDFFIEPLPPLNIRIKPPFHLSSTLGDIRSTFMGKIISGFIIKKALSKIKSPNDHWMMEVAKRTLLETPIRTLVLFSSGTFTFKQAEGIIHLANGETKAGFKKIMKG
jgi:beta-glucosidase